MKLRNVATCTRDLTWETMLPVPIDERLCAELKANGATLSRPLPRLLQVNYGPHVVVLVGERAQIRLSYLVPREERRFAAEDVFLWLESVVDTVRALGVP